MPTTFPEDRFDDLPAVTGRVGAHRAEQPRLHPGPLLLWSVVATVVLVVAGVFGTMLMTGRISLTPGPESVAGGPAPVSPVVDPTYPVLVLNATPQRGLAAQTREIILEAGWATDAVVDGDAGTEDFAVTTVYYPADGDEAAARGLADVIGGAEVALSTSYQPADDPATADVDESAAPQLVVVRDWTTRPRWSDLRRRVSAA